VDSSGSGDGPVAGSCEHSNGSSCSLTGGEFLEYLSDYQIFKQGCDPLS